MCKGGNSVKNVMLHLQIESALEGKNLLLSRKLFLFMVYPFPNGLSFTVKQTGS